MLNPLSLEPGARLMVLTERELDGCATQERVEVSAIAHQYLFEPVSIDPKFTLGDLFGLLEKDPVLVSVYRRDFAKELLEHALKGPVRVDNPPSPEALEYLELYQMVEVSTADRTIGGLNRLALHAMTVELQEDSELDGYVRAKGSRVTCGVSLTDIRELLHLPLRVKEEIVVCEGDVYSCKFGAKLHEYQRTSVTLGQFIEGVLWELSFHGAPQDQSAIAEQLLEEVQSIKHAIKSNSIEVQERQDLFDELDKRGFEALFESTGSLSMRDIRHALHGLADDDNVTRALKRVLGKRGKGVVIKNKFQHLSSREFRKALAEASVKELA